MKPVRLLFCAASAWSIGLAPALSLPAPSLLAQFQGEEQANIDIYQRAIPAVVTIQAGRSSGSGSIISPEGLVLTNEHVIRGAGRGGRVTIRTSQGKTYTGQVLGTDRQNDLALVRVVNNSDRFPTIPLAGSDGVRVGQRVYAIGSPFGLSGTLTTGILSRIDNRNGDLQIDATLNPGNSGGPLLNSRGELIGVNKAIISPDGRSNTGIGFATNVAIARNFVAQAANRAPSRPSVAGIPNESLPSRRDPDAPRLGVTLDQNLVIIDVERGSLAEEIGFRRGDQIVAINRRRLRGIDDVLSFLDTRPRSALFTVNRNRRLASVQVRF